MDTPDTRVYLRLIEEINDTDKMVKLHQSDQTDFMLRQYEARKEKLVSKLIKKLIKLNHSFKFNLIAMALKKYYPNAESFETNEIKLQEIKSRLA